MGGGGRGKPYNDSLNREKVNAPNSYLASRTNSMSCFMRLGKYTEGSNLASGVPASA